MCSVLSTFPAALSLILGIWPVSCPFHNSPLSLLLFHYKESGSPSSICLGARPSFCVLMHAPGRLDQHNFASTILYLCSEKCCSLPTPQMVSASSRSHMHSPLSLPMTSASWSLSPNMSKACTIFPCVLVPLACMLCFLPALKIARSDEELLGS